MFFSATSGTEKKTFLFSVYTEIKIKENVFMVGK